ncbi:DUF1080 domain-containing protein [Fulvivirgaceae bacterium BMA12]|uniref:DUF1080 domain-containing protein n=1 Tax=Agaribacillus aureus TaxID=3051825 RepID=A0ABT8LAZ7_9BACT|nr:DUF1080 domain-containing protein [Fulvivirgaceae bacterium BMA12]
MKNLIYFALSTLLGLLSCSRIEEQKKQMQRPDIVLYRVNNMGWQHTPAPFRDKKSSFDKRHHFKKVFDGKSLKGWQVYGKKEDIVKEYWKVENGSITCNTLKDKNHGAVWLFYEKELSDFELKVKIQAYRNSPGNSGIQVRSAYNSETHDIDGPQIDIHPSGSFRNGLIYDESDGYNRWIYPDKPDWNVTEQEANNKSKFYFADDEIAWNDLHIICKGTKIKTILNGTVVSDFDGKGILDDEIHAEQGVGMEGKIALQVHARDEILIRFKDIFLKEF